MKARFLLVCIAAFFSISTFLSAATIHVPGNHSTIQGAIDAAVNGDTVLVAPGTYTENIDFIGKAITVRSNGGAGVTVIDGGNPVNPDNGSVVTFSGLTGLDSVLDGFTVTNGTGNLEADIRFGGGICNLKSMRLSSSTVVNCIITENSAERGGGIWTWLGGVFSNNIISGNTGHPDKFDDGCGGGIYAVTHGPPLIISNNVITGNTVECLGTASGGGVWLGCYTVKTKSYIVNNTISDNLISGATGIYNHGWGGGIRGNIDDNTVFQENTIAGNTIETDLSASGGGAFIWGSPASSLSFNFISKNKAKATGTIAGYAEGGGLYYIGSGSLKNNIIESNSCTGTDVRGGGIYVREGAPSIQSNTIAYNVAECIGYTARGGGIYFYAVTKLDPISLKDTIVWANQGQDGPSIALSSSYHIDLTISYSVIDGGLQNIYYFDPSSWPGHVYGPGNIEVDPLFMNGPGCDFHLMQDPCQPGIVNPCVDTGSDPASSLAMDSVWTRTDMVPDSGTVDMGFHYGPSEYPSLSVDKPQISETLGGTVDFVLYAGTDNAERNYILLGGVTGTQPGYPLPGGYATLPLNFDLFTDVVFMLLNTSVFSNFMGELSVAGLSEAQMNAPPLPPGSAGITIHFAYCLNNYFDFVSNPVEVEVIP